MLYSVLMREIYFDNSSTTRVSPGAAETVMRVMTEDYGNPSSLHKKGVDAEKYIKASAKTIAKVLKVSESDAHRRGACKSPRGQQDHHDEDGASGSLGAA